MNKKPIAERIGDFMAGKGFYIVLFLCVAAIGISGYYLFSSLDQSAAGEAAVAAPTQVVVTPAPASPAVTPVKPSVPAAPKPTPKPSATPSPTPIQTPAPPPTPAPAIYTWPVKGEVIGDYSLEVLAYDATMGDWRTHSGMDIAAELGTQVKAVSSGTVESVEDDALMGTTVTIDHGDGLKSIYSNLAGRPTVEVGDTVSTGGVIGAIGRTAPAEEAKADHLHFEMTENGESIDPAGFLPPQ